MSGIPAKLGGVKRQRLEDCLNSFVGGLIKATEAIRHRRIKGERQELEWRERRRQQEESERIRREEEEKLKVLDREVASWHRSQQIRLYIDMLRNGRFRNIRIKT